MTDWKRRAIGILTLGGSSVGLAAIASGIAISQLRGLSLLIVVVFAAVFIYGIAIGLLIIEKVDKSMRLALPFWLAQVPVFQSEWVSYGLYTGLKFDVLFQFSLDIRFEWSGGAQFSFFLFPGDPGVVGANLVAVFVSYTVWKNRSSTDRQSV